MNCLRCAGIIILMQVSLLFAQDPVERANVYQVLGNEIPQFLLKEISVDMKDVRFEDALALITDMSDIHFNFNPEAMPLSKRISVSMENAHTVEVLLAVLEAANTSLMITDGGNLLIIPQSRDRSRGSISGVVKDADSGDPLPGANVLILGTSQGAATNMDGEFVLPNLLPGRYTIIARFIGYEPDSVEVQLMPGEAKKIDILLRFMVLEGTTVTVTAQAEGQMAAINQQIASRQIVNVVSSDRIEELPDANAAESVGRLPGVSINRDGGEATSVTIRGLSGDFNNLTVEGVRGVNLTSITPNMIDGIVLTKALTADMEGDATGGVVNFVLKDAPEGFRMQLDLKGGYSGLMEKFGMPKGELSVSNRFFGNRLGVMAQVSAYQDDRSTDYFNSAYIHASQNLLDQPGELYMDRFSLRTENNIRNRYGATLVMDYRMPQGKIMFKNFLSRSNYEEIRRETRAKPQRGGQAVRLQHEYEKTISDNIISSLAGEHNLWIGKLDWMLSHSYVKSESPDHWFTTFNSDYEAFTGEDSQKKLPPEELMKLFLWDATNVEWNNHEVDYRLSRTREIGARFNYEIPYSLSRFLSGRIKFGVMYRRNENSVDKEQWLLGQDLAGGYEELGRLVRDDVFAGRELDLIRGIYPAFSNFMDPSLKVSDFLKDAGFLTYSKHDDMKILADYFAAGKDIPLPYFYREVLREDDQDYKNIYTYSAAYIMSEINLGKRLSFLPGLRYEYVKNDFQTNYVRVFNRSLQTKEDQGEVYPLEAAPSNVNWLPMVQMRYKVTDWADLRAGYTNTLRRPSRLQYSPIFFVDQESIFRGNTDLKVETSENFDAQLSFYNSMLGLFTVGGFYKEIENFIYTVTRNIYKGDTLKNVPEPVYLRYDPTKDFAGFDLTEPVNNEPTAYVRGLELEWQTRLWYLPGPLKGLVLNSNIAFISSDTRYPQFIQTKGTPPFYRDKKDTLIYRDDRLQNQPNLVGNVSIGYDIGGFSARLSYYYQGNTLYSVSRLFPIEDKYKSRIQRWDLKLKQQIGRNLAVFLDFSNITNDKDELYYNILNYLQFRQNYGWQSTLGIRYIFQ